jgi:pyrimidine operon attenuation protein/uracil phosphoribosyltransferase
MLGTLAMRQLLDAAGVQRGLTRVAGQIAERHRGLEALVLIGIRRGGVPVAEHLRGCLARLEPGSDVAMGTVDITLYRDDASSAMPNPRIGPSDIPVDLDGRRVLLVDDVVGTGRTVRAALDAILDYGRPRSVELVALIDRGGRELPIQPDYCVLVNLVGADERVDVIAEGSALEALIQPVGNASRAPGAPRKGQS